MRSSVTAATRRMIFLILLAAFAVCEFSANAQPGLNFRRGLTYGSTVNLYFQAYCNGAPAYNLSPSDIKVFDNDAEITNFTIHCPDTTVRCPMSVSLVFDESGSMANGNPSGIAGEIAAGHAFVDMMDGGIDEAAVIGFDQAVYSLCEMTSLKGVLNSAVDMLAAIGATAIYDGMYAGLQELISNGVNQCRAVILLTDGGDNSSTRSASDVINLARKYNIRLYTIGLGAGVDAALLESIALQTDGKFYLVSNPSGLTPIMKQIATIILQSFQECTISYHSTCMDGSTHTAKLQLPAFCGDSISKTIPFVAERDTSTLTPLAIEIQHSSVIVDSIADIPILTQSAINAAQLNPATFFLNFDTSLIRCVGFKTPSGTVYNTIPITVKEDLHGVSATITAPALNVNVPAGTPLLYATFKAHSSKGLDTLNTWLNMDSWTFTSGCFLPAIKTSTITIIRLAANMACEGVIAPGSIAWDPAAGGYNPDTFTVQITVRNRGNFPAMSPGFKIILNSSDFELVSPMQDTIRGGSNQVNAGDVSSASWIIRALPRSTSDDLPICFQATFDNNPPVTCCANILVPWSNSDVMRCSTNAQTVTFDPQHARYDPMPFLVTTMLTNGGIISLDSVQATIMLPPELTLAGPDAPDHFTKSMSPSHLTYAQSAIAVWQLSHARTPTEKRYSFPVITSTSSGSADTCSMDVTIPAFAMPILDAACILPDTLRFDNVSGAMLPDPFDITLTCKNIGATNAQNVWAQLQLPPEIVLVDPADPLTKTYAPAVMKQYSSGDSVARVSWKARCIKPFAQAGTLPVNFLLSGYDVPTFTHLDTLLQTCSINVSGAGTTYGCASGLQPANPDSLTPTSDGLELTPNPFLWTAGLTNTGAFTSTIVKAEISFGSGDLSLAAGQQAVVPSAKLLKTGDSYQFSWIVIAAFKTQRRVEKITVTFTDDRGTTIACTSDLPIQGLDAHLDCGLTSSTNLLQYNALTGKYVPEEWTVTETITNSGKITLWDFQVSLQWTTPGGRQLVDFSQGSSNPKTFSSLAPGGRAQFTWFCHVISKNTSPDVQRVEFSLKIRSDEYNDIRTACSDHVDVGLSDVTPAESVSLPSAFRLYQNHPNPFNANTSISYDLPAASYVSVTIHDLLGREIRRLVSARQNAGHYVLPFDAAGLPTGMYLYRLNAGKFSETRRLTLVR